MADNEKKTSKAVPILIIILVVVILAAGVVIWQLLSNKEEERDPNSLNYTSENGIGYEVNATFLTSGEVTFSQPEGVAVRFKTSAHSSDGINFTCEIGNSLANSLDMYIDMYMDISGGDRIYTSGLLRPGEGITSFTALHEMPKGTYDIVLVPTLVEDDHKTIHAQTMVALTLVVG